MLRGLPYNASDPELVTARINARRVVARYNAVDPGDPHGARELLATLLGVLGEGSWIEPPFRCDYGTQIALGDRVWINMGCVFLDPAPIRIGDDVQLGPGVQLLTADHPRDSAERAAGLESAHPISIGARSWLGGGAIVLPGVSIGADVIVGAGSVVTRSLPDGVTAVGSPCRVLPKRAG